MKKKQHPNSLKNLEKGWTPGHSGNPRGRPISIKCIPDILRKIGNENAPEIVIQKMQSVWPRIKNMTMEEAFLRRAYLSAVQGESWAVNFIADRTEGKVVEQAREDDPEKNKIPIVSHIIKVEQHVSNE